MGEADKNELKEKQTSNWKKYLTFSFGNSKEKQEEKEPQEKEKINPKEVLKLTEESLQKKYFFGGMLPSLFPVMMYWDMWMKTTGSLSTNANALLLPPN